MSSRDGSVGGSSDIASNALLGLGAVSVLLALAFVVSTVSGSSSADGGKEGGEGTLGGRSLTSPLAAASSRFTLEIDEGGRPGPPVVVVAAGASQVCSVLLGDGAELWADAEVEWSTGGLALADGTTEVVVAERGGAATSCYQSGTGLEAGVHSVRWQNGSDELIDAVVVGDATAAGLVELSNETSSDVCVVRVSPSGVVTSGNDLAGVLPPDRHTRVELSTGIHRFEAEDCAGRVVAEGEVTVSESVTLVLLGTSVVTEPPEDEPELDEPIVDEPEVSPVAVIDGGPVAFGPVWASGVSEVGEPLDSLVVVGPENEGNFCLTWGYRNVAAGSAFELVWSVDGVTGPGDVSSGTTSPPADGNFWGCYGNPGGLPDGRYEAEWRIDGVAVFSESITVGPATPAELSLRNEADVPLCRMFIAHTGSATMGLDQLDGRLMPGESTAIAVSTGQFDVRAEACDGSRLLDLEAFTVGAAGVDVAVATGPVAFGPVWASGVSEVGEPLDSLVVVGPENEGNFCLTWGYRNVAAGSAFELVWSVDGVTGPGDVSSGTTSPPADGNFWGCYGNPGGLPDGRYEAEWRIDGVAVFSESITVGPATPAFVQIENRSGAAICSARVTVAGASTLGLNALAEPLDPAGSIRLDLSAAAHDIVVEDCAGDVVWAAEGANVPAGGALIPVVG